MFISVKGGESGIKNVVLVGDGSRLEIDFENDDILQRSKLVSKMERFIIKHFKHNYDDVVIGDRDTKRTLKKSKSIFCGEIKRWLLERYNIKEVV